MKTLSRFVTKFTSLIVAVLSCFDRVIFKGHLALAAPCELEYFVDRVLKVRRSDFMKILAPQYSDRFVQHAQASARKAGRTYMYRTGQFRKDEWAHDLIRDQGISEGLVGILCTQETCPSFALVPGPKRPQLVRPAPQQRVLYYYFLDRPVRLIHVGLQTWLPFTVQVYVNGHEWLASRWCRRNWASCSSTTRLHNSTTPTRPNASPTARSRSTGANSSTAGHGRVQSVARGCSMAALRDWALIKPSPPVCCSTLARP